MYLNVSVFPEKISIEVELEEPNPIRINFGEEGSVTNHVIAFLTNTQADFLLIQLKRACRKIEDNAVREKPEWEHEFCSRCSEHTDFEQDDEGEEWLSVCCGVQAWSDND